MPTRHKVEVQPIKLARTILADTFRAPDGGQGLIEYQGSFFQWYGNRWRLRSKEWLRKRCWRWMEDKEIPVGEGVVDSLSPTTSKVDVLVDALSAITTMEQKHTPAWIRRTKKVMPPTDWTIAFEDKLICCESGEVSDRTSNWFDPVVIPCNWVTDAECPRWDQCLQEWSGGDDVWIDLLQRWMGYCLLPHRRFGKWLLMHGKVRAGKGTIAHIVQYMIGDESYLNVSLDDLAEGFGLAGMEYARVLNIPEFSELHTKDGQRAARVIKNIVGNDPITINEKYKPLLRNVRVLAAPMMQSNEIPRLHNRARGLSSKMLMLPFDKTFEGHEQFNLLDVLKEEIEGIACWCVQGAINLTGDEQWPLPDRSAEDILDFHLQNNPFDYFLEARFKKSVKGRVTNDVVRAQWYDWVKRNNIKEHISKNMIPVKVRQESSWDIGRQKVSGTRFLTGLSLRKERSDEV